MGAYLLLGVVLLGIILLLARGFTRANPARVAQFFRAFVAAFSALAGTGLLFAGRFGLALIAIGATIMALRAMRGAPAGSGFSGFGGGSGGGGSGSGRNSQVETDTLSMQLDHATGTLEGEVRHGRFAGRSLDSLGLSDLLALLAECQREDPRSVALLETYLDRREPDWRAHVAGGEAGGEDEEEGDHGRRSTATDGMDEAKACSILGLSAGASVEEIKAAHRRLMTRLHPDHGGSSYLAAELNQAKEYLLRRRR